MKFELEINCDNAAFEEPAFELARILKELSTKLENNGIDVEGDKGRLVDYNGNVVGEWRIMCDE